MSKKVYCVAQFLPKEGKLNELFKVLQSLEPNTIRRMDVFNILLLVIFKHHLQKVIAILLPLMKFGQITKHLKRIANVMKLNNFLSSNVSQMMD